MNQPATCLSRRRFLAISASALATPVSAKTRTWTGTGLGAAMSVRVEGLDPAAWRRLTRHIAATVEQTERQFSLFRDSALTRLNRDGRLASPSRAFLEVCKLADRIHQDTGGAFDPTVQALWLAARDRGDTEAARRNVGWQRVLIARDEIRLRPGMALTFNGIAQGWCADRVADVLRKEGLSQVLIDMGEIMGLGRRPSGQPWLAAVQSPDAVELDTVALEDRALATSSPLGTFLPNGQGHIISPSGQAAVWSTVSVSDPSAAKADALSTAFCLMSQEAISDALHGHPAARCEVLSR